MYVYEMQRILQLPIGDMKRETDMARNPSRKGEAQWKELRDPDATGHDVVGWRPVVVG